MENAPSAPGDGDVHLRSIIMRYLENGLQIMEAPKRPSDTPHVEKVHSVGDVVHVFSHIRKTYRVYWTVITGVGGPPALRVSTEVQPTQKKSTRTKKSALTSVSGAVSPPNSAWVKLSDVEHAKCVPCNALQATSCSRARSVGTGVMKIWKMVSAATGWAGPE